MQKVLSSCTAPVAGAAGWYCISESGGSILFQDPRTKSQSSRLCWTVSELQWRSHLVHLCINQTKSFSNFCISGSQAAMFVRNSTVQHSSLSCPPIEAGLVMTLRSSQVLCWYRHSPQGAQGQLPAHPSQCRRRPEGCQGAEHAWLGSLH